MDRFEGITVTARIKGVSSKLNYKDYLSYEISKNDKRKKAKKLEKEIIDDTNSKFTKALNGFYRDKLNALFLNRYNMSKISPSIFIKLGNIAKGDYGAMSRGISIKQIYEYFVVMGRTLTMKSSIVQFKNSFGRLNYELEIAVLDYENFIKLEKFMIDPKDVIDSNKLAKVRANQKKKIEVEEITANDFILETFGITKKGGQNGNK